MPERLLVPCGMPGCVEKVKSGFCNKHSAARDRFRAGNTARGYDSRWRRVRRMKLQLTPLCERCSSAAKEVHHKDRNPTGPDRLAPANLESLCIACHHTEHRR